MQYMLLIYANTSKRPDYTPEQQQSAQQQNTAYMTEMRAAGVLAQNEGFKLISNVKTVRVQDGKTLTADAPFAETQQQLTGYIMLDCKDFDEAIGWATKNPAAKYGSIEVRQVSAWMLDKADAKPTAGKVAVGKS